MKRILFFLTLAFVLLHSTSSAQTMTEESYIKAREALDRSVAAYGGTTKLRSIQSFTLKAAGDTVQRHQSRKTFAFDRTPYQIDVVADLKNSRFSQVVQGGYPGGFKIPQPPGEKSFFERVVQGQFTVDPDALMLNPQPLKIEVLEGGRRILSDGTTTVEIHDIGPGPHTEEMLVAYLPNEQIIFQGDLLNRPSNGDYPIANETSAHFAKWLESKKLSVRKIIPVHGTVTTMDEMRKAVADMQRAQN